MPALRAALAATLTLVATAAGAAPFTPGNIVVYRVGNGTVAATSSEAARTGESDVVVAGAGDTRTVALRADREASGSGRVYTINAAAIDVAGNIASVTATCRVPRDLGK